MTTAIDLRSDTSTLPTDAMREAIFRAEVGDDMVGEDPTVNRLEAMIAGMLGMEAAVYACSGTQSNQMGIRIHCRPGDELLINETGHIANFEAGAPAVLSGITVRTIAAPDGMLDVHDLEDKVHAVNQHLCPTRLVCLENTTNVGGGRVYTLEQTARVSEWARSNNLAMHLDGARLFNACVAGGYSAADLAQHFDTVSICFSKGLGCPMGSVLVGSADAIAQARRSRKMFGGALRQSGMMAASAVYALENHIDRLAEDHANAKLFAEGLNAIDGITVDVNATESNLVFLNIAEDLGTAVQLTGKLKEHGVLVIPFGGQRMRACTHLDISRDDILTAIDAVKSCCEAGFQQMAKVGDGPYDR